MPTEDRSGTWYANRQRARAIYSLHLIEQQALNQGVANRMNSNGASAGSSTVFYATGTTSGSGEELAAVLQANSAIPAVTTPNAPTNITVVYNPPSPGGIQVSWTASSSPVTLYTVVSTPGDITKTTSSDTFLKFSRADGLVLGTAYTFVVTATNSAGTSPPSDVSDPIKAITFPDPPTNVAATDGNNGQSTVSWTLSTYDGESPITSYTVCSSSSQDPVLHLVTVRANITSTAVPGLTNGFSYIFFVTATNAFGEGEASVPSSHVIPKGTPTPPLNVFAVAGTGNANVSWEAPLSDGGVTITLYTITSSPLDFSGTVDPPATSILATGLTNGTPYTFTVYATNSKGDSPLSDPSSAVTPLGAPGPPTNVVATPGNTSADVTWNAPLSDGGSTITSYTVTSIPGNISITTSGLSTTVPGLSNGTLYTFTVIATNAIGSSVSSFASSAVTPRTVPTAPLNPFAIAGNAQADVFWTVPVFDGGSPIIRYTVIPIPGTPGVKTTAGASTTLLFTGLTNGVDYTFTIYATNVAGNSVASALTNSVTPTGITVPSIPQNVSASLVSPGKITVVWQAPASDGGSAILSYTVTPDPADVSSLSVGPLVTTVDFDNVLVNGRTYTFIVVATNAVGSSLPNTTTSIIPITKPGVVQSVVVTPRNQGAIVRWSPPSSDGGSPLTNYRVYHHESTSGIADIPVNLGPSNLSYEIFGLTNSILYDFQLGADNALYAGDVPGLPIRATPTPTVADPPNIISVQTGPGVGEVTIEFAPNIYDGGGIVVNYLIKEVGGGPFLLTTTFSPAVLAPLLSGFTYQFTVQTVTSIGTSLPSAPSSPITL